MTDGYRQAGRPWLAAAVCVALAGAVQGAPPHPGKATCATCHRAEAQSQPKTAMGIGIELPPHQEALQEHPKLTVEEYGYRYDIERKNGVSTYRVSDGSGELTLPIRYAFGVYNLTFVLEYQGSFYEGLVSYYQNIGGLGTTMGDEQMRPRNLTEAMGRKTPDQEIAACFNCHGTGGVSQGKLTLASLKPGVSCGHCHAGADAHLEAMAGGKAAPVPRKLGEMAAEEMSNFCGECHRTWESVVGLRLFGEKNVRFQPYRLANSRCFLGDDRRIRCTACHDPHVELVREEANYDRACLSCHSAKPAEGAAAGAVMQKACPVADRNCVSCHMPKVQVPGSPAVFRDHEIRVAHAGDPYPH
jgi:hypothetical protein